MILSFFTQKSTRSAKLSSVFAERFSGEGQADFAINKAHKVSLKGRNNLYISCVFNGFKYIYALLRSICSQETCGNIGVPHYFLCLLEVRVSTL